MWLPEISVYNRLWMDSLYCYGPLDLYFLERHCLRFIIRIPIQSLFSEESPWFLIPLTHRKLMNPIIILSSFSSRHTDNTGCIEISVIRLSCQWMQILPGLVEIHQAAMVQWMLNWHRQEDNHKVRTYLLLIFACHNLSQYTGFVNGVYIYGWMDAE